MIDIKALRNSDKGRWVEYWPHPQKGRIKSWRKGLIFVVYRCGGDWEHYGKYTAAGTHPKALNFIEEPTSTF